MDDPAAQKAKRDRQRRRRRLRRRLVFAAIIIGLLAWWQWPAISSIFKKADSAPGDSNTNISGVQQSSATVAENCDGNTPDFNILTPGGASADSLGGCVASPPDNENSYFVFLDTVQGINIQVTEQILPEEFATDTDNKLANLAENYNRTITADGNITVRLGASSSGDQFLIFSKSGLLIIIKAAGTLNDGQWVEYIDSLK